MLRSIIYSDIRSFILSSGRQFEGETVKKAFVEPLQNVVLDDKLSCRAWMELRGVDLSLLEFFVNSERYCVDLELIDPQDVSALIRGAVSLHMNELLADLEIAHDDIVDRAMVMKLESFLI